MNIKTTNLRLNLEKPDHIKAYEILKSSGVSYTKTIVSALITFSENESNNRVLFEGITEIVRNEIGSALQNLNFAHTLEIAEIEKIENQKNADVINSEKLSVSDDTDISEVEENDDSIDMDFLEM